MIFILTFLSIGFYIYLTIPLYEKQEKIGIKINSIKTFFNPDTGCQGYFLYCVCSCERLGRQSKKKQKFINERKM